MTEQMKTETKWLDQIREGDVVYRYLGGTIPMALKATEVTGDSKVRMVVAPSRGQLAFFTVKEYVRLRGLCRQR